MDFPCLPGDIKYVFLRSLRVVQEKKHHIGALKYWKSRNVESKVCQESAGVFCCHKLYDNIHVCHEDFEEFHTCPLHHTSTRDLMQSPSSIVQGRLVHVIPEDTCTHVENPTKVSGAVAMVRRGGCSFFQKVRIAEEAGAIGVIVINNEVRQSSQL